MSIEKEKKVQYYKNKDRANAPMHTPYIPQYQLLGIEPAEYKSAVVPNNTLVSKGESENPRSNRPVIREDQPEDMPHNTIKGAVPNIGNNMEHTWSSVDGDIVDDLSVKIDYNKKMIDNNFILEEDLPKFNGTENAYEKLFNPLIKDAEEVKESEDLFSVLHELVDDSYLLIVNDVALCSGPLNEIQDQARALVFGEHEYCDGNAISVDDLMVIKKIKIKMGLFIE